MKNIPENVEESLGHTCLQVKKYSQNGKNMVCQYIKKIKIKIEKVEETLDQNLELNRRNQ